MARPLYYLVFIPSLLLVMAAGEPVHAQTPAFQENDNAQTYTYHYEVYAGGIHAVESDFSIALNKDRYDVHVNAGTRGWLRALAPWSGRFRTKGHIENGIFYPEEHISRAVWDKEEDHQVFRYESGDLIYIMLDEYDEEPEEPDLDPDLTRNTTDILSAALTMMQRTHDNDECHSRSMIYDGKRRFEVVFRDLGGTNMPKSRYNGYAGPARLCEVEIVPKGGKWRKEPRGWLSLQEQGRKLGQLPRLWLADLDDHGYAVPVKMQVKTDYGTLMMHLKPE